MTDDLAPYDLEAIYDTEVAPLMAQIIAICKQHQMPMLATFCYRHDDDGDDYCSSLTLRDDKLPARMRHLYTMLRRD